MGVVVGRSSANGRFSVSTQGLSYSIGLREANLESITAETDIDESVGYKAVPPTACLGQLDPTQAQAPDQAQTSEPKVKSIIASLADLDRTLFSTFPHS